MRFVRIEGFSPRRFLPALCVVSFLCGVLSCSRSKPAVPDSPPPELPEAESVVSEEGLPDLAEAIARLGEARDAADTAEFAGLLSLVFDNAAIPPDMRQRITGAMADSPAFILDLLSCLEEDPSLRTLVDKQHPLPEGYEPADLVELRDASYRVNRANLTLRKAAADSLEEMARAAKAEGITLLASSAYRSYAYQAEVYNRIVREMGREAADRESARPGFSQHQTGLTVDFGSIDDSFAETAAGRWMASNAPRFGWSLSFPQGYEALTGYRWESWHYRYVGKELASFIDNYFDGIQQYALRFIYEWETLPF